MDPGRLNERWTIQAETSPPENRDQYGQPSDPWQDVTTVWASVSPLSGRELSVARQRSATVTHEVRMRSRAGVTAANRLVNGDRDRVLNLESVRDDGRHLIIDAVEQTVGAT